MATSYLRAPILSFYDLPLEEQDSLLNCDDDAAEINYIEHPVYRGEFVRMDNFVRASGTFWDGHHGTSYFDGLFIKIGRTGEEAVIAHRHW